MDVDALIADISVFADLGTDPPESFEAEDGLTLRYIRLGEPTDLIILPEGRLVERTGDSEINHSSLKAMLASDRYGALRKWAINQANVISQEIDADEERIKVHGLLDGGVTQKSISDVENHLAQPHKKDSSRVLLIDGPAGIGKTFFILELAFLRAKNYTVSRRPLILHVQSRGRNLSYIYDLIAFSLQRLRVDVTYDQVPILLRHGLITIAIDGFDELADPDGYSLAWAQVSEIIANSRGKGTIILAGRETFIGRARVVRDIAALREDQDEISVLTLQAPSKGEALGWLASQGWAEDQLNAIEPFLETGSLALRPFFLKTLSDRDVASQVTVADAANILTILMDAMNAREVTKFGDAVDSALGVEGERRYVAAIMGEAARDMAENGSSSISDATLAFLVDVVLDDDVPDQVRSILKARVGSLAYLTNDERRGHKRFFHEKFYEYFLASIVIDVVSRKEQSKFVSRGLLGSSFLETLSMVLSARSGNEASKEFYDGLRYILSIGSGADRSAKNAASMLLSTLSEIVIGRVTEFSDLDVEEARITGTVPAIKLRNVIVSQLDARGGDLSQIDFENSVVISLIADSSTFLGDSFPVPSLLQDVGQSALTDPVLVRDWLHRHMPNRIVEADSPLDAAYLEHPAVRLLLRACRMRQYWLRRGDDLHAERILSDTNWPLLEELLEKHDLLRVEFRGASGTNARFMHIRQQDDLLDIENASGDVAAFYRELSSRLSE